MVSIISRSDFVRQFESDEYTTALVDFLLGNLLRKSNNVSTSNANEISKQVFYALQNNDKELFSELYQEITRRKPKSDSEWVHNDILLFAVTLGTKKFNLNKQWLDEVLSIRIEHSHEESKLITQTYIDVLKGNLENAGNHRPLMIVLKYLLGFPVGSNEYVNSVYEEIIQSPFPYSKAAFINLICLKGYDIILLSKGLMDLDRQRDIEDFITHFNKRINQVASFFWWLLLLLVVVLSVGFLLIYIGADSQNAEKIDRILNILPFFGFSGLIIPVLVYKKRIIDFFKTPFLRYYGYKVRHPS
jgi:hypothetical protein